MSESHKSHKPLITLFVLICFLLLSLSQALFACTSFCIKDDATLVFGKNYDWHIDTGLIIVNKRNVTKKALLLDNSDKPAEWTSKYGSVTFNQYGREIPNAGINEKGLILEVMMLPGTVYPDRDTRPAVMAWVQYQLDNCSTIEDIIATDKTVRTATMSPMPLHYLACDRKGNVAIFEFLKGKFIYYKGADLPINALTNDTYENSLNYLKQHTGFGGDKKIPLGSTGSLDRFVCATDRIKNYNRPADGSPIKYAFETLDSVKQSTQWMIVYDLKKMEIHFKTASYPQIRTIRVSNCDFDPKTPVQVISINTSHKGLLNPYLHHYETDLNRWMIYYTVKHTPMLSLLPDNLLEMLARYPESPTADMPR